MPPAEPNDEHLAELRRRWESEPDSRVFLQLAEEYRRRERYGEAAKVLESGLAKHPNHVSAQVALGRVRLALGDADGAAGALERALSFDATNLVANKALVEAHLARGERSLARQRLEIYRLLNESDPGIEDLERRLRAGSSEAGAPPTAATPAETEEEAAMRSEPTSDAPERDGRAAGESQDEAGAAALRGTTAFDDAAAEQSAAGAAPGASPAPRPPALPLFAAAGPDGDPFGELDTADARRLYLEGLGSEGLFPVAAPPPVEPVTPAAETPAPADQPADPAAATAEPAPEAAEPPPPTAPAGDPEATVTLGRLYLDQGHPRRAREIFSAVLEREPDNAAAHDGLALATATEPAPVTAQELLQDADPDRPVRVALLHAYLARIRRGRGRRDVS